MREFNEPITSGSADWDEHSVNSKAKKVIIGPASFPADPLTAENSIAPIIGAGGELVLLQGKAYRVIATADMWFRQAAETGFAASANDVYLPAKTPIIIKTDKWPYLAYSGGGTVQAVEVL